MHHALCIFCAYNVSIIIFALWCMHHWVSIMTNESCHMHHFILRMEHHIMALHWHCNHSSQECIISMVIGHVHHELEHSVIIPWHSGIAMA